MTLIDTYGRVHRDLRVSVTDRCNLRCTYCMPPDFADWMPGDHLLSIDELMTVISVAVDEGVTSIRLTGGEPLIRPDIVEIVHKVMDGQAIDLGGLSKEMVDYVKTAKVILGHTLYSDSWLEI